MRISLVLLFCLFIVVINGERGITKVSRRKSAYDYLRSVRGTRSCADGSCPFWERHGRSFVSLRCSAREYRECTCLHQMCFRSCIFSREVCNLEMVSCLRQICRRCMPASSQPMCALYDSMAEKVTEALAVFACYSCCADNVMSNNNTSNFLRGIFSFSLFH